MKTNWLIWWFTFFMFGYSNFFSNDRTNDLIFWGVLLIVNTIWLEVSRANQHKKGKL